MFKLSDEFDAGHDCHREVINVESNSVQIQHDDYVEEQYNAVTVTSSPRYSFF